MKIISQRAIIEAIIIITISSIIGVVFNEFHLKGIQITHERPPLEFAPDTVLAYELPTANITINQKERPDNQHNSKEPLLVNTKQVHQLLTKDIAILIDARSEAEFLKAHIPNAQNIPIENLAEYEDKVNSLPQNKWIICYCDGPSCDMGDLLAYELMIAGFRRVAVYRDGIDAWENAGKAIQRKESSKNGN